MNERWFACFAGIQLAVGALFELFLRNIPVYWYSPYTSVFINFYTNCWFQGGPISRGFYWCTETPTAYVFSNIFRWRQAVLVPKNLDQDTHLFFAQKIKPLDFSIPHPDTLVYKKGRRGRRVAVPFNLYSH